VGGDAREKNTMTMLFLVFRLLRGFQWCLQHLCSPFGAHSNLPPCPY